MIAAVCAFLVALLLFLSVLADKLSDRRKSSPKKRVKLPLENDDEFAEWWEEYRKRVDNVNVK